MIVVITVVGEWRIFVVETCHMFFVFVIIEQKVSLEGVEVFF